MKKLLIYLVIFLPAATKAQLSPRQIFDHFVAAHQSLNFSNVSTYIHPQTLAQYRDLTSAVIKNAVEKYGADAVAEFFQGTPLSELKSFSDQEYWAFLMASTQQFSTETRLAPIAPVAEFWEGRRLLLVYPVTGSLISASEMRSFPAYVVCGFEQENGIWKMVSFRPNTFEVTLYLYLGGKRR